MSSDTPVSAAAVYLRMSLAFDTTKVDDQERICRDLAERLGWPVAEVYCDNNKSAWKHNRKRKDWDRMLADVDTGRRDGIITYHNDRLVRQGYDLEVLFRLAEGKGIRLASPTGTKNLDNADDRFVMRIEAAVATRSSDDTSRRKKTQYERMRRQGLVRSGGGGGRAYGFETDGVTHRPDEVAVIRAVASNILAGQSLGSLVRELNRVGLTTTAGNPFRQASLRRTLLMPRMAGLMPDGVSLAAWAPVLERDQWETLHAVLGANPVPANVGKGARYLLTGIARCGACGGPLYAAHGATAYRCPACAKIRRSRALLDAYIAGRVVARLNHEDNPRPEVPANPGLATEYATLTRARAEAAAAVADPSAPHLQLLLARLDAIDRRLGELRAMSGEDARSRLLSTHAGITDDEFDALPLSVRRALVDACYSVIVLPSSKRGPGFRSADVNVTPR